MVLLQSGSALNSVTHVATEGPVDAQGQVSYMGAFWWLRATQICVLCAATMVLSGSEQQLKAMPGSVARVSVDV